MKHTYILEEGIWRASAKYYDANQNCIPVIGETKITHNELNWILDGYMELQIDNPITSHTIIDPRDYSSHPI